MSKYIKMSLTKHKFLREANLDAPLHRAVLKALRRSIEEQYRNENGGLWYFVDPPPPYPPYSNLSYSDGMYAFAPFAALYGSIYGDADVNLEEALRQMNLLYSHGVQASTGLILHGYDASAQAPWADPNTGASPILWGRSLAWYMIGVVDTLEIVDKWFEPAAMQTETVQHILHLFRQLVRGTVAMLQKSSRETGRCAVWQVMDRPGEPENFVEASASAMISYVLAKGSRLGYLVDDKSPHMADEEGNGRRGGSVFWNLSPFRSQRIMHSSKSNGYRREVLKASRELYEDVMENFVAQSAKGDLEFQGTSVIASLHEARPYYEVCYLHTQLVSARLYLM